MSEENYKTLIADLGKHVKLPELKPDADNYCCLGFDDKIVLHIQYNKEGDVVMLFCQVGTIDEDKQAALYPKLLKANLFWQGTGGATLGVDDDTREVMMAYQLPLGGMDFPKFQQLIEGFTNTAELWINTLMAVQQSDTYSDSNRGKQKGSDSDFPGLKA